MMSTNNTTIGIVTTWFERGAAYVSKAFYSILKENFNVKIYARGGESSGKGNPNWDMPDVTWAEKKFGKSLTGIDEEHFFKWIEKEKIKIVIFNEQNDFDILYSCKKKDIIILGYIDYYQKNDIDKFKIYDGLICNTKRHYSVFKDFPNAIYIPWGTDLNIFSKKSPIKRKYSKVIFFHNAGRLGKNKRKGTKELIDAFRKIKNRKKRLIIHTQVPIGVLGAKYFFYCVFSPRVKIIKRTVSLPGLYYKGDIYVYPSKLEGIGLTICEALASGLPVVTTDSPPMNEFIIDGYNGKLIKVDHFEPREDNYYWDQAIISVEDLQKKMEYFLEHTEIINQSKKNALEYVRRERDWNKNGKLLVEYIKKFI